MALDGTASEQTLVLRLRRSRRKARVAAAAEVACLLVDAGGRPAAGGPLSTVAGTAWVTYAADDGQEVLSRLTRLGYSESVDLVVGPGEGGSKETIRWRGREIALRRVYQEGDEELRAQAPDRRSFLLECDDGVVRRIDGYRGGRGDLEHRALPVVDARLLVNLCGWPADDQVLLDPFAGAGGIVVAANARGWSTWSADVDPALRFGLAELADEHRVADAQALPWPSGSVDAIATEPPYHPSAHSAVEASIGEIARVLRTRGRAALMVAAAQREALARVAAAIGMRETLNVSVDRKGTHVAVLAWER
jgi:hypothetical protein